MCRPAGLIRQPLGRSVEPRGNPGFWTGLFVCAGQKRAARKRQSPVTRIFERRFTSTEANTPPRKARLSRLADILPVGGPRRRLALLLHPVGPSAARASLGGDDLERQLDRHRDLFLFAILVRRRPVCRLHGFADGWLLLSCRTGVARDVP